MAQTIQIKNGTGSSAPATLLQGELAINVSSGSLWYGSGSSNATHSNWMFGEITASNKIRNHLGNHTGTGNITASGTVNAGFFVGNGSGITNLSIDGQGALLESELTNVAAVKAINQQLTTTSNVQFASLNVTALTSSIVTSSVVYASGSNIFGDEAADNHTFNGSVTASGNISSSGDINSMNVFLPGGGKISFDNSVDGTDQFISGNDNNITIDGDDIIKLRADTAIQIIDTSNAVKISINPQTGDAEFDGTIEAAVKSFSIPHQGIEGKKLVYGVLEGPEHSVYVRGETQDKIIELPEEWKWLVHDDSITVQLTAIGKSQNLHVKNISDNKIFISNDALFSSKINAYYTVNATRKDVNKLKTVK